MNIFDTIWERVLSLFSKKKLDSTAHHNSRTYKAEYEQTQRINFTSIFANSLSNKAVTDSTMTVKDATGKDSRRSEWIGDGLQKVWANNKVVVAQALGKGGKVLVPYVQNGRPYVDVIDQGRMVITAMRGDEITGATLMADIGNVDGKVYYRFADYELVGNVHTIRNRATTDGGGEVELSILPEWEGILPEITINGVEHILFGYLKCPTDSREDKQIMGVPITYGGEETIRDLHDCLNDMRREYRLKKSFVGADDNLFGKDSKLPDNGLFKRFNVTGLKNNGFWEVFDPAIRDSSYLARFQQLCGMLESTVGVSPGILTKAEKTYVTDDEIKQQNSDTFAMIDSIRENIETAFRQTAYALDVLAEFYGATPAGAMGDWQIIWDWDYSMMESSTETFTQLSELESRGMILPERLVSFVTGMNLEEAKAEVEAAQALQTKTIDSLLTEE
ncbi:MAG: hypothetical protein IJX37_08915 [Oscillospiraceae bacterium]|nr:hypothetical protein [Oscillospiraceae bacterium]